jgi:hypothetical protein
MKKKTYFKNYVQYRIFRKFYNLQNRIRGLMQSGEYSILPIGIQSRLIRKLNLLYKRISGIVGKQTLRWATTVVALIISGTMASAQFKDPVNLSGIVTGIDSSPYFVDFDGDGDLDVVVGNNDGKLTYIENTDGRYAAVHGGSSPFYNITVDTLAAPALSDVDFDHDVDLVIGNINGNVEFYRNDASVLSHITGTDNPFDGIDIGYSSSPFFADLNNDHHEDLIVGDVNGKLHYFRNDSSVFTEMTGTDNPFDTLNFVFGAYPRMADYDKDGDLDLYVGNKYGDIHSFLNESGSFIPQTGNNNPFHSVQIDSMAVPFLVKVDNDNDWDLVVGDLDAGHLRYFVNDGGSFAEKTGQANPFEGVLNQFSISPAFSDLDSDGDLDLVAGDFYDKLNYFKNTSGGFVPVTGTDNPFDGFTFSPTPKASFADLDKDHDLDLAVGDASGKIRYFVNESNDFFEMTGVNNPFDAISLGNYISPILIDLDNDLDNDLVLGKFVENGDNDYGEIAYYQNVNNFFYERTGNDNPFSGLFTTDSIKAPVNPAFADLDNDGDMDLYVGNKYGGKILTFINTDGVFSKAEGSANPFDGFDFSDGASPAFADIDKDGDMDLYVGEFDKYGGGKLYFVENTSEPTAVHDYKTSDHVLVYSHNKVITLDAGELKIDRVEVYSVSGGLVLSANLNADGKIEIPAGNLTTGVYFVRTYNNGSIENHKVLIR